MGMIKVHQRARVPVSAVNDKRMKPKQMMKEPINYNFNIYNMRKNLLRVIMTVLKPNVYIDATCF